MQSLPDALAPLSAYNQFVLYKISPSKTRPGKTDKFPIDSTGKIRDAHDPSTWLSAEQACLIASQWGDAYGVGFVFTADDPFFFVDIDDCVVDGKWSPVADQILGLFSGAGVEVSNSGKGLHIIGKYDGDEPHHSCKNIPLNLEFYTSKRFVALTGNQASGSVDQVMNGAVTSLVAQYFTLDPNSSTGDYTLNWTDRPREGSNPIKDDDGLIKKALASKSVAGIMGGKATFKDLWEAKEDVLALAFPDDGGNQDRAYNASSADAALASHLAFWTCCDCERIKRLMLQSALVRDKWTQHKNILTITIGNMCAKQVNVYQGRDPIADIEVPDLTIREGFQLMPPQQQINHFDGFTYVASENKIFTTNGMRLKSEAFNVMFGGYTFPMDTTGDKTTRKAWECFTESQALHFPKADGACFRPDLETGVVIREEGLKFVNTYMTLDIDMRHGDVTRFLDHLTKLLPVERDRTILLSYMAACIQYKGYKIQWAPLIQGVEGNGKTLFTRCVEQAVGERYTHMPPAAEISEKYNSWLFDTLFIGVEDIYVPDHKVEVIEVLKPMITSTRLARRAMATDQTMHNVCCNFIFNSNHKNAIRKTLNDRRYAVFYTAQQSVDDLVRDGMTGRYFPDLYDWLRKEGYAFVTQFLHDYHIPEEFNPTGLCQVAPSTSSTAEAVEAGMGVAEQEVLEAISEDRTGFANGWVSSKALANLLSDIRKSNLVPLGKRQEMMNSLGYVYHPALKDGRSNVVTAVDGSKPRLFIAKTNTDITLTDPKDVVRAYSKAQGDPGA